MEQYYKICVLPEQYCKKCVLLEQYCEISCLEVSYDLVPEELKKSCSLDSEENHLKCFSFQVDKEN